MIKLPSFSDHTDGRDQFADDLERIERQPYQNEQTGLLLSLFKSQQFVGAVECYEQSPEKMKGIAPELISGALISAKQYDIACAFVERHKARMNNIYVETGKLCNALFQDRNSRRLFNVLKTFRNEIANLGTWINNLLVITIGRDDQLSEEIQAEFAAELAVHAEMCKEGDKNAKRYQRSGTRIGRIQNRFGDFCARLIHRH